MESGAEDEESEGLFEFRSFERQVPTDPGTDGSCQRHALTGPGTDEASPKQAQRDPSASRSLPGLSLLMEEGASASELEDDESWNSCSISISKAKEDRPSSSIMS